jgi:D-glycerate 3-kinase
MSGPIEWPNEQLFIDASTLAACHKNSIGAFRKACAQMRIENDIEPWLGAFYVPFAAWLQRQRARLDRPIVVALTGGQGSGKSTVCALLAVVLHEAFSARAVTLSIDDIYATHDQRVALGQNIHPLLATRGPPGTHDTALGMAVIDQLLTQQQTQHCAIPAFDKASDDRRPANEWQQHTGPLDFILFEGWCVGAIPQAQAALHAPINALESNEDADGTWRRAVNTALSREYKDLFSRIDVQVLLRIDGMERVFEWRQLQETKLRAQLARDGNSGKPVRVMTESKVNRFIQHYERITRHILTEMPDRADLVFDIDATHNPASVRFNKPIS